MIYIRKYVPIIHNNNYQLKAVFWIRIPVDLHSNHQVDPDPYFKYRSGSSEGNCFIKYPLFGLYKGIAFEKKCFLPRSGARYESVDNGGNSGSGSGYVKTYMDPNNGCLNVQIVKF